jgi:hypothetical protein
MYTLGNWMFKQNYYKQGTVRFPDFCRKELAFEWNFTTDEIFFHFFEYDRDTSKLCFLYSNPIDSLNHTEYKFSPGLTDDEYKKVYRKNHYHKRKGLPIYYWKDPIYIVFVKNKINKLRDMLVLLYKRLQKTILLLFVGERK